MTVFCFVRHGAYDLLNHALGGRADHSLNDAGRAQAEAVARGLAGRTIAAVVSSPVQRARETAAPIGALLATTVQFDPAFAEIDFGDWTGAHFDALADLPAWQAWNRFRSTAPVPGGETMLAAQARAIAGVQRWAGLHPGAEIVVVSHADIIKAVLVHFLGAPLDFLRRIEIAPGSLTRVEVFAEDARVIEMNLH